MEVDASFRLAALEFKIEIWSGYAGYQANASDLVESFWNNMLIPWLSFLRITVTAIVAAVLILVQFS